MGLACVTVDSKPLCSDAMVRFVFGPWGQLQGAAAIFHQVFCILESVRFARTEATGPIKAIGRLASSMRFSKRRDELAIPFLVAHA